jgi:hypothetical protein
MRITTGLMLLALYAIAAALPFEVNSAAYVAGAGHTAVFVPVTQDGTTCGRNGCNSSTSGYLLPGKVPATWPGTVAVGRPFPVRTLIRTTSTVELISGTVFATGRLLLSGRFRPASTQPAPWLDVERGLDGQLTRWGFSVSVIATPNPHPRSGRQGCGPITATSAQCQGRAIAGEVCGPITATSVERQDRSSAERRPPVSGAVNAGARRARLRSG